MAASSSKKHKEDGKEMFHKLAEDLHELVNDKDVLRPALDKFLMNLVDEITLGLIFDVHRKAKTEGYDLDGQSDDCEVLEEPDIDVLSQVNLKVPQYCTCPICTRSVDARIFARHFATCRNTVPKRNLTRNVTSTLTMEDSKEKEGFSFSDGASDDDDDADWSSGSKKRKKKKNRNLKKKSKGTPKKVKEIEYETVNVEVGRDEDLGNTQDFLNGSGNISSTESTSSSQSISSVKKRERSKVRKSSKKERQPAPHMSTTSLI